MRIISAVRGKGADLQIAEDIAQEVAVRAIQFEIGFHDVDDFCGWGCTVAKRLYVDHIRLRRRFVGLPELPDRADGVDVQREVESRVVLHRVVRAIKELDPTERDAILAGVNETRQATRKESNRENVRRHRARNKLLYLTQGIAAFWAFLRGGRRTIATVPVAAVTVGVFVLLPVVIDGFGDREAAGTESGQPSYRQPGRGTPGKPAPAAVEPGGAGGGAERRTPATHGDESPEPEPSSSPIVDLGNGTTVGTRPPSNPEENCAYRLDGDCVVHWPEVPTSPLPIPVEPAPVIP